MARNRIRLPWAPKKARRKGAAGAAAADAPFFEKAAKPRLRADSPEMSLFTPAEEAESHRRWRRAVIREWLSGPVSGTERLGFGLSAAALAALFTPKGEATPEEQKEEVDAGSRNDAEGAGEVFAALKSAAMGRAAG